MLEEVRRAVGAGQLEPAAGVDPDADGGHPRGGRVGLRDDAEARGERGDARVGEAEEGGVVGVAGHRRGVAEEAVGGRGRGAGVEEAVEVGQGEPALRSHDGGGRHVLDGFPQPCSRRRPPPPPRRRGFGFLLPIILAAGEGGKGRKASGGKYQSLDGFRRNGVSFKKKNKIKSNNKRSRVENRVCALLLWFGKAVFKQRIVDSS